MSAATADREAEAGSPARAECRVAELSLSSRFMATGRRGTRGPAAVRQRSRRRDLKLVYLLAAVVIRIANSELWAND